MLTKNDKRIDAGNMTVAFLTDYSRLIFLGKEGVNMLAEKQPPLFSACFRDAQGNELKYSAFDAKTVKADVTDGTAAITFGGFSNPKLSVTVTACGDDAANAVSWKAEISGSDQLEWLEFPGIAVKNNFKENGGNSKILWPYNEGVLVDSISDRYTYFPTTEPQYPSLGNFGMCPGMVFAPFLALMADEGNLYLGAHDKEQNSFNVDFAPYEDGVLLRSRVYPGITGGRFATAYETVTKLFSGNWYGAAEIYRSWFEENCDKKAYVPVAENKTLPAWYHQSPIVVTYCVRGHHDTDVMEPNKMFPYVNAMPIIDDLAEKLNSKLLVILMHWEGSAPWAPPFVMPPYGGEELLQEYIDALHESGHLLGVYCSGLGWTEKSNIADYNMKETFKEKNLKSAMCVSPKQELPYSKICTAQRVGYDICPATDFAHDTLKNEAVKMDALGIDYIQLMDQNHGGTPYFCYSKDHGHPPVPGTWESAELKKIIQKIKQTVTNKELLLGCESAAAETFIPEFMLSDNRFELNYLFGLPVPLYSYMYHEYIHNFMGNQVCGEDVMGNNVDRFNLLYRMAYSFTAGDLLTLVINDEGRVQWAWGQSNFDADYMPDHDQTIAFAKTLNAWRKGVAGDYLNYGKMVEPFTVSGIEKITLRTGVGPKKISPVLYRCYQNGNKKGQIMVNYTDSTVTTTVNAGCDMLLYTSPTQSEKLTAGAGIQIPPYAAVLLEELK
ncbi:MAG: DUF6259 domain-containing protein [Clostridia bacterium]|nr:DUF6259 domain-containing protein [Clostridia bacterium]